MDEESYVVFPWMNGGAFSTLAELELAYGDNCVDGAIADTAELWARRSGTSSPCVGSWSPETFSLDDEIREWATSKRRRPDETGLYITGFRAWVEHKLSESAEFGDFVWNRFVEFSVESMSNLKKNVKIACGDDILLDDRMMYKFRDRIGILPYYVMISVPAMPNDTEERLSKAVEDALKPKPRKLRFRLPKSAFASSKAEEGIAAAMAQTQAKSSQKKQERDRHVSQDGRGAGASDADVQVGMSQCKIEEKGENHV